MLIGSGQRERDRVTVQARDREHLSSQATKAWGRRAPEDIVEESAQMGVLLSHDKGSEGGRHGGSGG